jgi:hypothetical protein
MIRYILLFIISLTIFTVYKAPASLLQNMTSEFTLTGKIIDGSAYSSKFGLVKFEFSPSQLLLGKLSFALNLTNGDNNLKTNVAFDFWTDIVIYGSNGYLSVDYIKSLSGKFAKTLNMVSGDFKISELDLNISNKQTFIPDSINANLLANKIAVVGEKLGSYNIDIKTTNGVKIANITDNKDSAFKLNLKAEIVDVNAKVFGSIKGKTNESKELLNNFGISENFNQTFDLNKI